METAESALVSNAVMLLHRDREKLWNPRLMHWMTTRLFKATLISVPLSLSFFLSFFTCSMIFPIFPSFTTGFLHNSPTEDQGWAAWRWKKPHIFSSQTLKSRAAWFKWTFRSGRHLPGWCILDYCVSRGSKAAITLQCSNWMEIWTPSMEGFWLNMSRNHEVCYVPFAIFIKDCNILYDSPVCGQPNVFGAHKIWFYIVGVIQQFPKISSKPDLKLKYLFLTECVTILFIIYFCCVNKAIG